MDRLEAEAGIEARPAFLALPWIPPQAA